MKAIPVLLAACLLGFISSTASALITGDLGNEPVTDPGWPRGALEVANLKSRVGWWEGPPFGGGQYQHLYRGDTEAFQAALDAFSKMRTPVRELVIHDGPQESFYLKIDRAPRQFPPPAQPPKKADARIDWTFTLWVPASWHRLYSVPGSSPILAQDPNHGKSMDPPRIDVYLGAGGNPGAGLIDWSKVKVPTNVRVIDKRAAAAGVKPVGGAVVHVNVYDMATGKPVEGAVLRIDERSAKATEVVRATGDADGFVEATKVPAGIYRISIEAPGYATRVIGYEELRATTYRSFDIELSKAASVTGRILDQDGKPVANVTVRTNAMGIDGRGYDQSERAPVKTDDQGRFELTGLPTGYTHLHTYAAGYHMLDSRKVHPAPTQDLVLTMGRNGEIKGKVTGQGGEKIAPNTQIYVVSEGGRKVGSWSASITIRPDGSFGFKEVPEGKYYISTDHDAAAGEGTPVEVVAGKTAEVVVEVK